MPARLDIALQRNEAYAATWLLTDDDGTAIDLTGKTVVMQVKSKTSDTVIQAADVEITDAEAGEITILLNAGPGNPLHAYGVSLHTYEMPYDVVLQDDDVGTALVAGYVVVSRGISG